MNALPKLLNQLVLLPLMAVSLQAASTYKVKSGDTLSSIARKNGTTASQLMKANGMSNPNKLRVGQILKISASAPTRKATSSHSSGNHTVKAGETLYSIARSYGLSISQLTNMNPGLNPSKLSVGQRIKTKGGTSAKPKPKAASKPQPLIAELPKPALKSKPNQNVGSAPQPRIEPLGIPTSATLPPVPTTELAPAPKENLIVEEKIKAPASISSVLVNKEISFGALANRHRTSTKQLNALNGWNLKPTTVLAKDSEVYVPGT